MPGSATPIASEFADAFGPIFVINLPERRDRRREFAGQLRRIRLDVDDPRVRIYPAVRPASPGGFPSVGARGCFLSHLGVLQTAVAEGLDHLIVCEDDLDFAPDFEQRAAEILAALGGLRWDILYGGHHGLPRTLEADLPGSLVRLASDQTVGATHFIVLRRSVFAPLIAYLEAILARPPGHPDGGPMHVDGAYSRFRADHPDIVTLAALPPLGHQRPSRTDIHGLRWFDRFPVIRAAAAAARRVRGRVRRR